MNNQYKRQVALLIRIMPSVYRIRDFAVHGGSAINLFYKNMPRYSVDIDITYIPTKPRQESLDNINLNLETLKGYIERSIPGIHVIHKPKVLKLQCTTTTATVKIEVNGIKRGLLGETTDRALCQKAQQEFQMGCTARIVSFSQLYGGKIAAALGRQHPRDLFDCKYMDLMSFDEVKNGLMFCLLGSDKPIVESLHPNSIDQSEALVNQFDGMSDIPFTYDDYKSTREELIRTINSHLTKEDKYFLVSFEKGQPDWSLCCAGDLSKYSSVRWKLKNIEKLKVSNPKKFEAGIKKLKDAIGLFD